MTEFSQLCIYFKKKRKNELKRKKSCLNREVCVYSINNSSKNQSFYTTCVGKCFSNFCVPEEFPIPDRRIYIKLKYNFPRFSSLKTLINENNKNAQTLGDESSVRL